MLIGSFLNVLHFPPASDLTVWSPARSFCPGCEDTIAWYDNIPLVSFFLLRGRARCCHEKIPWRLSGGGVCDGAQLSRPA
ncbi:MAG: prepilin peptidase [Acidobacteriota bacterium]